MGATSINDSFSMFNEVFCNDLSSMNFELCVGLLVFGPPPYVLAMTFTCTSLLWILFEFDLQ